MFQKTFLLNVHRNVLINVHFESIHGDIKIPTFSNRFRSARGVVGVVRNWLRCLGKTLLSLLCAGVAVGGRPGVRFWVQMGVFRPTGTKLCPLGRAVPL